MASYQSTNIEWIEPNGKQSPSPIVALLLNLIGVFIPICGFVAIIYKFMYNFELLIIYKRTGYIYMGQKKKGIFFLLLWLLPYFCILLVIVPFIGWLMGIFMALFNLFRIISNIYHVIDVYTLASRLQQGKPITIGECTFFSVPLLASKVLKQPDIVVDGPSNPPEYFSKLSSNGFAPILQPNPSNTPYQQV